MLLDKRDVEIREDSRPLIMTAYGGTDNESFNQASFQMLHDLAPNINYPDVLESPKWEPGHIKGSDYRKIRLCGVSVDGYGGGIDIPYVYLVHIFGRGVSSHAHLPSEFYLVPDFSEEGILKLGKEPEQLSLMRNNFYYMPPRIMHALETQGNLFVIVFSFSNTLVKDFTGEHELIEG